MKIPSIRQFRPLRSLRSPSRIQDFLNEIPTNRERYRETCASPLVTLERNRAHCMEGALVAALALAMQGHKPLILDLRTAPGDFDHLVAVFRIGRHWGGVTKTNHAVLRYREPVYRDIRELAMSFFHEYFLHDGRKTLRSFSTRPFDLTTWKGDWMTSEDDLWDLSDAIDTAPHTPILTRAQIAALRRADTVEIRAGKLVHWR
jgi:hypothetical protein